MRKKLIRSLVLVLSMILLISNLSLSTMAADILVESITLDIENATVIVGQSITLTATVLPENATNKFVVWESLDDDIATVDENGVVTGVEEGETFIIATAGDETAYCMIEVVEPPTEFTIVMTGNYDGAQFYYGKSSMYNTPLTSDGVIKIDDITHHEFSIKSGQNAYIKIAGDLTGLESIEIGAYTIQVADFCIEYSVDLSDPETAAYQYQVKVSANEEPEIAASMGMVSGFFGYGYTKASDQIPTFILAFLQLRTNDSFGLKINYKTGESSNVPVERIDLDKESATVKVGQTITLAATVLPENATDPTVTWSSSDEGIATVSDGVVTGVSAGTATITAAAGDKTATCEVTVTAASALGPNVSITEASGTPIADVTATVENGTATLHVTAADPCVVVVKKADGTYERLAAVQNADDSYDFSQSGYTSDMEFHVLLKGDANGDGIVSTDDAMQLARACLSTTHTAYLAASELNQAAYGAITTDLAMQIARSCLSSDHVAYQALTW